jgi:hypothetical protein
MPGAERCSSLDESVSFEHREDLGERGRRVVPRVGHALHRAADRVAAEVDLVEDEVVGRLRFHVPRLEDTRGEVLQVVRDDHLGTCLDRGSSKAQSLMAYMDRDDQERREAADELTRLNQEMGLL